MVVKIMPVLQFGRFKKMNINDLIDDRYRIERKIGEGGMSVVYGATDIITKKPVAIKIIKGDMMGNPINLSRFEREARAAASLSHPNIVRVINLGTYEGRPYMANEYINGQNLRDILDKRSIGFLEACDIMYQLTSAVAHAHEHSVIHRDIKPQNVYLTADGTIKLGDFGIATFENSARLTRSETIIGSVHYLAPEISRGQQASYQSDIYSLGVTFFELITRRVPFEDDTPVSVAIRHIKDKFPSPRKYIPSTPKEIERIILKACKKNPQERYKTVKDMRKDIERILRNPELIKEKKSLFSRLFKKK